MTPFGTDCSSRRGFTLIELLVVIAIIGVLVALLLPAVQMIREAARRTQCASHLSQLIIAVNHYEMGHNVYPAGTLDTQGPVLNARLGYHHNWMVQSLPYLEMENVWDAVDKQQSIYHSKNGPVQKLTLNLLLCPSSPAGGPMSCYAACHHDAESPISAQDNGVFFLNSRLRHHDIKDGTSQTIFLGEKLTDAWDMEWCSGTRGTLRNTGSTINQLTRRTGLVEASTGTPYDGSGPRSPGMPADPLDVPGLESDRKPAEPAATVPGVETARPGAGQAGRGAAPTASPGSPNFVGGFGSEHVGGAMFAFGDGSIHYLSQSLSPAVLRQLGHRADGNLPPEF
jgi:prepilin-type N-terminal cleavage/methylation domain-containing protein